MSGKKGRSGRRGRMSKIAEYSKAENIERAMIVLGQVLADESIDKVERAKLALPLCLKTMTDKQAITTLTASMALNTEQVDQLITLAKRNSLIYKDLEADTKGTSDNNVSDNLDSGVGEGV